MQCRNLDSFRVLAAADKQYATVRGCYMDIAKIAGVWSETKFDWDGDVASLSDSQLERFQYLLEKMAFGDDQEKIMAARRQAKIEAGTLVVGVESEPTPALVEKEDW